METLRWTGDVVYANLTLGTTGNSRINLSTLVERTQSGVDGTTGVKIDSNRDYYFLITADAPFYCTVDRTNATTPSVTDFQYYGERLDLVRSGHAETNQKDLYLHALVAASTGAATLGIMAFPRIALYQTRS